MDLQAREKGCKAKGNSFSAERPCKKAGRSDDVKQGRDSRVLSLSGVVGGKGPYGVDNRTGSSR